MRAYILEMLPRERRGVEDLISDFERPASDITSLSAAALAQVLRDIIAGEGPTVSGRMHFSRTIDAEDASLCARILIAAGRTGIAVSRAEADVLFAIDAAGSERHDAGRFDDLLAKAVVHHVMSASGISVPSREIALDFANPLAAWASSIHLETATRSWLQSRLGEMRPSASAARAIVTAISAPSFLKPQSEPPVAVLFDIAA
jgi:hypothetical protein